MHVMYPREVVDEALRLTFLGLTDEVVAARCGVSAQGGGGGRDGGGGGRRAEEGRTAYCPVCGTGTLDPRAYSYLLGLYLGDGYIGAIRNGVDYLSIF